MTLRIPRSHKYHQHQKEINILEEIITEIKTDLHIPKYILLCDQITGLIFSLVKPFDTILVLMILVCRKYGEVDFLRKYESNTERP